MPDRESKRFEFLDAKPIRNDAVTEDLTASGHLVLRVPLRPSRLLGPPISWIFPVRQERKYDLDPLGVTVWRLCDGRRTVEEVAEVFSEQYRLTFQEGLVSVSSFLQTLVSRKLVALAVPKGEPAPEEVER